MSSKERSSQTKFIPVSIESLKVGQLVERPLYVFLASNARYILLVKPLHPLEERIFGKFLKLGQVFSTQPALDLIFPRLQNGARDVRAICDDEGKAPFEKNREIAALTDWLAPRVLHKNGDAMSALFFFHRAFGVPKPETLVYLSDLSVEMYERSLKLAAVSGVLALWLGYSDTAFLTQFAESVFCEEISSEAVNAGRVPGVQAQDYRFQNRASGSDELQEMVSYARVICGFDRDAEDQRKGRVRAKLERRFSFEGTMSKEAA